LEFIKEFFIVWVSLTYLFYGRRAIPGKNRRGSRDGWEARKLGIHKRIIHGVGFFDLIILWQEGHPL
jgi:hypothetical protein